MIFMGAIICLVWCDNITHFSSIPRILVIYASLEANDRDKEMYSLIDGSGIDDGAVRIAPCLLIGEGANTK